MSENHLINTIFTDFQKNLDSEQEIREVLSMNKDCIRYPMLVYV